MDIAPHLDAFISYSQGLADAGRTIGTIAALIVAVAVAGISLAAMVAQRDEPKEVLSWLAVGFLLTPLLSFGAFCFGESLPYALNPDRNIPEVSSAIAAQMEDEYSLEVSSQRIQDAFHAEEGTVTGFSAVHNGERKSLTMSIDWDEKELIVFEGNTELNVAE